jgi:hypothetical protein
MVIKKLNGQKVSSKLIKRQASKCNIKYPIQIPIEEAKRLRQAARKKYQQEKTTAQNKRMQFLTDRIIHHEDTSNKETARKVRKIAKAKARMEEHKEVKTATKDFSNKINHITIPDISNATGFKNIYDKE